MKAVPIALLCLLGASPVLSGCAGERLYSEGEGLTERGGTLAGAATGALAGSAIGDGGLIAPALGAVGGAVVGEEAAESDPIFD